MNEDNKEKRIKSILSDYEAQKKKFDRFEECLVQLVRRIVESSNVIPHDITSRRKGRESFLKKLKKPGKVYTELSDITDIVGVRITTYFESDVDEIKNLIEKEFEVDEERSIDKKRLYDPDRFGYMSLHYIIGLKKDRLQHVEYSSFDGMKAEIQIRSILQHTWAEIEHDLGYKSKYVIPIYLKRRFSQLSSLLELADREFLQIKKGIEKYEEDVLALLTEDKSKINVDKNSISIITEHDENIISIDKRICALTNANLAINHDYSETVANMLLWLGINRVSELYMHIDVYKNNITLFAENWISQKNYKEFNYGISLMYICYMILAEQGDEDKINEFAKCFSLGKHVGNFGEYLIEHYSVVCSRIESDEVFR
ncbi:hypothetical protein CYL31_11915 [Marinomonas sp. A3A]|uniref:GTP pyrophosphokinase n=1 Tax=Marinomonas sp. A3A TaxID=2065312 RepID=UPI001BB41E7C|nr:hypothetical protein [Marinomonas sp. A3A]QUX92073.1 hypothetical protein CYL31_11915 [Marinomonas sp. A3A]